MKAASARKPPVVRQGKNLFWWFLILVAGLLAYGNSLRGPFVFDDRLHLLDQTRLHHLWPMGKVVAETTRPTVDLTLAINYALGKFNPFGYHLSNLVIHLLSGLFLFGVVRRTFQTPRLKQRYEKVADGLAGAVALLWVVHPLNTQAVTYLIQRSESLMGLFYLLTLYCLIRAAQEPRRLFWKTGAIVSCALGMGSKAIMVTAPGMLFLYDALFLAGSWREVLRRRGGLYVGLGITWGVLLWSWVLLSKGEDISVGGAIPGVTAFSYTLTQPRVILHYLKLSIWPNPLVFDYEWPVVRDVQNFLLPGLGVGTLLGLTFWALMRGTAAGFLGVWFFGVLAPSSSVIPIADCAFEYRMYLPLIAVVVGLVVGGYEALKKVFGSGRVTQCVAAGAVILWAGILSGMTFRRNLDYRSEVVLWEDTIQKRPENFRAHHNLARALEREGEWEQAISYYRQAIRLKTDYAQTYNSLGVALAHQGRVTEAIEEYRKALGLEPNSADTHNNLGSAFGQLGQLEDAKKEFEEALKIKPGYAKAHFNLAMALEMLGRKTEAVLEYQKAKERGYPPEG